jgi:thioredoxin 1
MSTDTRVKKVTDQEFVDAVLESGKPAVVDFWATWCVPCKALDEVLHDVASAYDDRVSFYKVDVNESNQTANRYSVRSIPMLLFFNGGEIVDRAVGSLTREAIEEKLQAMLESA